MTMQDRLRWQQLSAPDFRPAAALQQTSVDAMNKAFEAAGTILTGLENSRQKGMDAAAYAQSLQFRDPMKREEAYADGSIYGGYDPAKLSLANLQRMQADDATLLKGAEDRNTFSNTLANQEAWAANADQIGQAYTLSANGDHAGLVKNLAELQGKMRPQAYAALVQDVQNRTTTGQSTLTGQYDHNVTLQNAEDDKRVTAYLANVGPSLVNNQALQAAYANAVAMVNTGKLDPRLLPKIRQGLDATYALGAGQAGGVLDPATKQLLSAAVPPSDTSGMAPASWTAGGSNAGGAVGERNNNRGNIRDIGQFKGVPGYLGTDERGFAIFDDDQKGVDAGHNQLRRYMQGKGVAERPLRTVSDIVPKWAPVGKENTPEQVRNYIAHVSRRLGVRPGDELTEADIPNLFTAMSEFENGQRPPGVLSREQARTTAATNDAVNLGNNQAFAVNSDMVNVIAASTPEQLVKTPRQVASEMVAEGGAFAGYPVEAMESLLKDVMKMRPEGMKGNRVMKASQAAALLSEYGSLRIDEVGIGGKLGGLLYDKLGRPGIHFDGEDAVRQAAGRFFTTEGDFAQMAVQQAARDMQGSAEAQAAAETQLAAIRAAYQQVAAMPEGPQKKQLLADLALREQALQASVSGQTGSDVGRLRTAQGQALRPEVPAQAASAKTPSTGVVLLDGSAGQAIPNLSAPNSQAQAGIPPAMQEKAESLIRQSAGYSEHTPAATLKRQMWEAARPHLSAKDRESILRRAQETMSELEALQADRLAKKAAADAKKAAEDRARQRQRDSGVQRAESWARSPGMQRTSPSSVSTGVLAKPPAAAPMPWDRYLPPSR